MYKNILPKLVPHFFAKEPITEIANPDLLAAIEKVKACSTPEDAIALALDILSEKYDAKRFQTYIQFYKWFEKDPNKLWARTGFMHCTQLNYLCRILLIKSGKLTEDQIRLGYSLVYHISPHQFLWVSLNNNIIRVDPWKYDFNGIMD